MKPLFLLTLFTAASLAQSVPVTWDESALAAMHTPLNDPARTPKQMPAAMYNRMPALIFYKTWPVYATGREPAGYQEMLHRAEPEIVFDAAKLHTPAEWARAGEAIFDAPTMFQNPEQAMLTPRYFPAAGVPVASNGTYPYLRYVIRKKGEVELGGNSCASCHTRVMADGRVVKGAQGNFPIDRVIATHLREMIHQGTAAMVVEQMAKPMLRFFFAAPWIQPDPYERVAKLTPGELAERWSRIPGGVVTRDGATFDAPPQIPDLIGIRERRYLNHTGSLQHRSPGDLMRYSAIAQGADIASSYGDFRLAEAPPPFANRYTDEALYALAMYLYSLEPPTNPNRESAESRTGQAVFQREGCGGCHTAPLYTNNGLLPADVIGTDPELAMRSRRGTGLYKVPSLKGVWYRGPFGHGGESLTLEDWLTPQRLAGSAARKRVTGHEFGMKLAERDRRALIAFLRTL